VHRDLNINDPWLTHQVARRLVILEGSYGRTVINVSIAAMLTFITVLQDTKNDTIS